MAKKKESIIKKLVLNLGGKEIEITPEEGQKLYEELKEFFCTEKKVEFIPFKEKEFIPYYPPVPYYPPFWTDDNTGSRPWWLDQPITICGDETKIWQGKPDNICGVSGTYTAENPNYTLTNDPIITAIN